MSLTLLRATLVIRVGHDQIGVEMTVALSFSERIRAASWDAHQAAADSAFMQALLGGALELRRYADLVAQHYFAYEILEAAGRAHAGDPVAGRFLFPELQRVPALEADLADLLGPAWRTQIAPTPATEAYGERMRAMCFTWPGGFVAHHYVRYLGDLSGGQIIRRPVEENYALNDHAGTRFYVFDQIADLTAFKAGYRALLDDASWDEAEQERITAEILVGYECNTRVLCELDASTAEP